MGSFAARFRDGLNQAILDHVGGETLISGANEIIGAFWKSHREIEMRDGSIMALDISFDCQITDWIAALAEGDDVSVESESYRFIRRIPDAGDETGLVIIELGRFK